MSAARLLRALLPASCLVLGGCVFFTVHDLHVTAIDDVSVVAATDTPGNRVWPKPDGGLLAVAFSTDLDVVAHAVDYENSDWLESSICKRGRFDETQLLDDVSYFRLADGKFHPWNERLPAAGAPHYQFYIGLVRHYVSTDATPSYDYDLQADPRDICFRLRGAQILGLGYMSNTMVVPAASIADAIKRAGG